MLFKFRVGDVVEVISDFLLEWGVPQGSHGTVVGGSTKNGDFAMDPSMLGCWVKWDVEGAIGNKVWGCPNHHLKLVGYKATEKAPAIDGFLKGMGFDRIGSISKNVCSMCGGDATKFEDPLSEKEYTISGLCQKCQDRVYGDTDQVDDEPLVPEDAKLLAQINDFNAHTDLRLATTQLIDRIKDYMGKVEEFYPEEQKVWDSIKDIEELKANRS